LCFFYEVNSDFVSHSDTLIPGRHLATLFAFHANTLLFLTARKILKPKSLRSGVKAAYKKAWRALTAARRDSTDAKLHELRKRIKNL
jgi:hypothetical protein